MATYTDNYQLTKPLYSETADVAAINNNMDKIDDIMHASQVSLAPAYDQYETYNTGDVVMYEFLMYECLEDEVTGVWDATKWQRTTAGEHGGGGTASDVEYDNTDSGMTATNVQDAIDELKGEIEDIPSVEANPQGEATEELTKIGIGNAIYEIVGGETIYGKASGAVASFSDGSANPIKSIDIGIVPLQSGSGTPSPNNPMPISGWYGANVDVSGINSWDEDWELGTLDAQGNNYATTTNIRSKNYLPVKHDEKYYISSPQRLTLRYYDINKVYLQSTDKNGIGDVNNSAITIPSNCYYIRFAVYSAYGNEYNDDISINYPSTDTEYHAHVAPTTYTIPFEDSQGDPLTIYGGEIHIRRVNGVWSGEVVETWKSNNLGELEWAKAQSSDQTYYYFWTIPNPSKAVNNNYWDFMCENYKQVQKNREALDNYDIGLFNSNNVTNRARVAIRDDSLSSGTATEFQTAVNNIKIVYRLETPNTYPIDPANIPNIVTLLGDNNMFADTGDINEVIYIRDLNLAFNELWDLVHSNSGTRSLNLMKGAISETKEDIEEPIKEEEETKEGKDENQR